MNARCNEYFEVPEEIKNKIKKNFSQKSKYLMNLSIHGNNRK